MVTHLKTNSSKLAYYRLKIRKVIEFFLHSVLDATSTLWEGFENGYLSTFEIDMLDSFQSLQWSRNKVSDTCTIRWCDLARLK